MSLIPAEISARMETADKLSDADRKAILAVASSALADFLPKTPPVADGHAADPAPSPPVAKPSDAEKPVESTTPMASSEGAS